jgi:hypothetical protein
MVLDAMEDRGLPQNPEIWLPSIGFQAPDSPVFGKPHFDLVHRELAHLLDDDAQLCGSRCLTGPDLALTAIEIRLLDNVASDTIAVKQQRLSHYVIKIATLGGYLARASEPPPGSIVIWRGLSRLRDIEIGATMMNCG